MKIRLCAAAASGFAALALATPTWAGSHLWRFNEVFSNADGTIQFIELKESLGSSTEHALAGKWIKSVGLGNQYDFDKNITEDTANRHLLLATPAFAALPGAPTPDHLLPPEAFFDITGDTLEYWMYGMATWTFGPVPTNGVDSLGGDDTIATNSPTNFAGETGSVVVPCDPADVDLSGGVDSDDLVIVILAWGPNPGHPADITGDDLVNVEDLLLVILGWGPC
ncbi:MAG: hypothetical protein ACYTGC_19260 [Planctomycetota bacterium]|jgi:hypothetical protein